MNNKSIFEKIYNEEIWNGGNSSIPLSGPGSSLQNAFKCSEALNNFIYKNHIETVLDLGCGDLTWISKSPFFNDDNIEYTGVDIVSSLIDSHKSNYPSKKFYCEDLVNYKCLSKASIIILRDVIFHLKNDEILSIFENIRNHFDYILITSCNTTENTDKFDKFKFSRKNLHKSPFYRTYDFDICIDEKTFDRKVYLYSHDNFYATI